MAKHLQSFWKLAQISTIRNATAGQYCMAQMQMSQYGPKFIEPIVVPELLSQPLDDADERKYRPIKAANTDQNTGLAYDPEIAKFTNYVMRKGKKKLARMIVERAFENIKRIQIEKYHKAPTDEARSQIELNPANIFHQAVNNCSPILILKKTIKGGVVYQVPFPVTESYQRFKAMNWIIDTCKDKDRTVRFYDKLAWELLEAAKNEGKSVRKKQDLHKQCEANKAYAHFRW